MKRIVLSAYGRKLAFRASIYFFNVNVECQTELNMYLSGKYLF